MAEEKKGNSATQWAALATITVALIGLCSAITIKIFDCNKETGNGWCLPTNTISPTIQANDPSNSPTPSAPSTPTSTSMPNSPTLTNASMPNSPTPTSTSILNSPTPTSTFTPTTPNPTSTSTVAEPTISPPLPICDYQTRTFDIPDVSFTPANWTKGDKDFGGNGPIVNIYVKLWPADLTFQKYNLELYMSAKETKSDWTTVDGYLYKEPFFTISIPTGYVIDSPITYWESEGSYTDTDHEWDTLDIIPIPYNGPVQQFVVFGDGVGNDVGYNTKVTIKFNKFQYQIRQTSNCH